MSDTGGLRPSLVVSCRRRASHVPVGAARARLLRTGAMVALGLGLAGCGGERATAPASPGPDMAPVARAHLSELLDLMQAGALRRQVIDWPTVRASTFAAAAGAQTIAETRPAVRVALAALGDGHSFYRGADGATVFVPLRSCLSSGAPAPAGLPSDIGYVRVGGFSGTPLEATTFATAIQETIRAADRDALIGWIVDLRGNGGGNMWPMIAGLGPLLGEGGLGAFVFPDGRESLWAYRDGAARLDDVPLQSVATPYRLRQPTPRIAVLVDNGVGSSGEATFLAFRGRPATRSFGVPTCGLSTANSTLRLRDGATLNLTVAVMADRNRVRAGDQVAPDEIVGGTTAVVERAVAWLRAGN